MLKYLLLAAISASAQITVTLNNDTLTSLPRNQVVHLSYKTDFDPQTSYITTQINSTSTRIDHPTKVNSWNLFESNILVPDSNQALIYVKEYRNDGGYSHDPVLKLYQVYSPTTSIRPVYKNRTNTATFLNLLGRQNGAKVPFRWKTSLGKR